MSSLNKYLLEACTDSIADSVEAEKCGMHRIELCSALEVGGLTPPLSLMEGVINNVSIPVHVMIRPRAGDFLYSDEEFNLMLLDIRHAKKAGAAGVVFGILTSDGSIDVERTRKLISEARPMKVTIHRAFDMSVDPFLSLEALIGLGADILLTSGQRQTAEDGLDLIKELVKRSGDRIQVMAGSGVNGGNVKLLASAGISHFHFTVRKPVAGPMKYRNEALTGMGSDARDEFVRYIFDEGKVKEIWSALR